MKLRTFCPDCGKSITLNVPRSMVGKALSGAFASKGGHARAAKLTAERRKEIAVAAVTARWKKRRESAIAPSDNGASIGDRRQ